MFMAKKIVSELLMPVPLALFCSIVGLFFLWFTRRQQAGKVLVTISLFLLLFFSFGLIPNYMLGSLERQYPQYNPKVTNEILKSENQLPLKYVVVLGGGHIQDPTLPVSSQLSESSLIRVVEGVLLYRKHPGSKLVLSGGNVFDPVPEAKMMKRAAMELGAAENEIIMESKSRDTLEQVRSLKSIVKNDQFVVITSASHMPRAMAMFKKAGLKPIPAPVNHEVKKTQFHGPDSFFPSAANIENAETAIHEYLGMIWAKLRRQI